MDVEWIKKQVKRFPNKGALHLSQATRGAMTRQLEAVITRTAPSTSLSLRDIRLRLSEEIFGRAICSFNELSDAEMLALNQWIVTRQAEWLADWLGYPLSYWLGKTSRNSSVGGNST
jgi:hypothetical protein